jgi:hypothetical protein
MRECAATADWELGPDSGGSKLQMENERSARGVLLDGEEAREGVSAQHLPAARENGSSLLQAESERAASRRLLLFPSVSVHYCCPPAIHCPSSIPIHCVSHYFSPPPPPPPPFSPLL